MLIEPAFYIAAGIPMDGTANIVPCDQRTASQNDPKAIVLQQDMKTVVDFGIAPLREDVREYASRRAALTGLGNESELAGVRALR